MTLGIFTYTNPRRDAALENDWLVHEYTHGITNRMTGGGTGRWVTLSWLSLSLLTTESDPITAASISASP